ncbi:PhzF family phenazine biosynthesis isomerase [Streptosporangium fragile]|uniref:PhzF family phenazine biosynthesis isomerase n=1 Tax=Streptosporangium fragile TaxID=46186 RepID=A0ABN3VTC4_9ACTN
MPDLNTQTEILRYAAFTRDPEGGNPAGVVLSADGLGDEVMQKIAADVGFSETAFLFAPATPGGPHAVRYFSPLAEVGFCGHATVALAVAYADRHGAGRLVLQTRVGTVPVETRQTGDGFTATLVSVPPSVRDVTEEDLHEALAALRWTPDDLDAALPPRIANAGNDHLVLAARTRERLGELHYDFDRLGALMAARGWTTLQLVWKEDERSYHSRNPFPPGGVVEDPATGAAAAAFGGYLRELGLVAVPTEVDILQGEDMGRPSALRLLIPADRASGISVTGTAVPMR